MWKGITNCSNNDQKILQIYNRICVQFCRCARIDRMVMISAPIIKPSKISYLKYHSPTSQSRPAIRHQLQHCSQISPNGGLAYPLRRARVFSLYLHNIMHHPNLAYLRIQVMMHLLIFLGLISLEVELCIPVIASYQPNLPPRLCRPFVQNNCASTCVEIKP